MSSNCVGNSCFVIGADRAPRRGFTLVELLVVIGIIALLISMLLPTLSKTQRAAKLVACASNLKQLGAYMNMYASDNKGALPPIVEGCKDNGSGTGPDFVHYWTGNPASNDGPLISATTSQDEAGTADVWAILESDYKLPANSPVCICPQVLADRGTPALSNNAGNAAVEMKYPNAAFSYRYSEFLGGMQVPGGGYPSYEYSPTGAGPILVSTSLGNYWFARPWKLGNIANPSQCAVLIENNTAYWKASYNWSSDLNYFFSFPYPFDITQAPNAGHQMITWMSVAHNQVFASGFNSDGSRTSSGQGNVLYADGSVQVQIYHQGTPGVSGGPSGQSTGWIDNTAIDPDYSP